MGKEGLKKTERKNTIGRLEDLPVRQRDNRASAIASQCPDEYWWFGRITTTTETAIYAGGWIHEGNALGNAIAVAHHATYPAQQPALAYQSRPRQITWSSIPRLEALPPPNTDYNIYGQPVRRNQYLIAYTARIVTATFLASGLTPVSRTLVRCRVLNCL